MIEEIKTLLEKDNVEEKAVKEADIELSAEVVEPIAHNPEAKSEPKIIILIKKAINLVELDK